MTSSLARPTFDASFVTWLETAPMEDIMDAYVESYKEAHGIKARWLYGSTISREEFADMFVSLGADIKAENDAENARNAAFVKKAADLGLADFLSRNSINNRYDLMDYEDRQRWADEGFPRADRFEVMAVKAGWQVPGKTACH